MAPMIAYFGITFFIALAGIGWLLYRVIKFRKPGEIVFLSWTMVMLFLIIAMRRFDYYFAINAAIIVAYVTVKLFQIIGSRQAARLAIVVAIVFCLPLAKQSIVTASSDYGYATQDWAHTAQYLKEQNTLDYEKAYSTGGRPPYGVFSWWSYGYWLMAIGHQAVYTNNGGGNYRNNAKILLSQDYNYALNQLRKNKLRYVVICEDMFKSHGLSTDNLDQTFMYKAYYQQINDLYLVCQYGDVKTFETKEAIK
jgi:dolichyl-diphosphooligosaccharide--protein glycosyltransferase